jgi:magnesium-transporting ATPase (P-type)
MIKSRIWITLILFIITIICSYLLFIRKENDGHSVKDRALFETMASLLTSVSAALLTVMIFYIFFGKDSNLFD